MHIEKNVFENLFNTIMDTPRTKDNVKARKDIALYCDRSELHIFKQGNKEMKPKASYTMSKPQVKKVCEWLTTVKFPDGYASNIKGCVNVKDSSFYSFKSHECHVFIQRLLPIVTKGMIPDAIWDVIIELCTFFRVICSRVLHIDDMHKMKTSIVETICKLEKVFPPGFFDSMEHLLIHLPHEAILGGPLQYRWMFLYERKLGKLKRTVRNKARVEGSIVELYRIEELSTYCSLYFDETYETRLNRDPRNFAPDIIGLSSTQNLSILKVPSKRLWDKSGKDDYFTNADLLKAHTYILLNCEEVMPTLCLFNQWVSDVHPGFDEVTRDRYKDENFAQWFEEYVRQSQDETATQLKDLARGPVRKYRSHNGYFVNGYKFHTRSYGNGRVTQNSGVCVKGSVYNDDVCDYYGMLDEVLEVEYHSESARSVVVLFKCHWFDPIQGVKVNKKHGLVDIKYKSKLRTNDPYVLASQSVQVYYASYPSMTRDLKDWWVVVKTKPRGIFELADSVSDVSDDENLDEERFFQENDRVMCTPSTSTNEEIEPICLVIEGEVEEVDNIIYEEDIDEEGEFEDLDYDSDEDMEDELSLSDHSSDNDYSN